MYWKIFTDANTKNKANRVLSRFISELDINTNSSKVEPYHKGGFICTFDSDITFPSWQDNIFLALQLAQKVGRGWILTGDINNEVDAWSNDSSISGVTNIQLQVSCNA